MATCKHGATEPHGEIGKDWCAGPPRSWYFEAGWRRQLEDQMNLDPKMFTRFAEAQEIDGSQVPDVVPVPHVLTRYANVDTDSLKNFVPMGWFSEWGEHWYADPAAPLHVRDWGAEVSFDGEHWTNALTVSTPIYDTLVAERGEPRHC